MPETTLAAVLCELGQPLRIMDLELPALKPGQVLVDVAYSGVCRSQLNEISGFKGPDKFLPHTLGHEGAGMVRAVGEGVTKVSPGDAVVLSWLKGSGMDVPSATYQSADGKVNSGAISTFMHRTVTCENRLTAIPPSMPLKLAALLGCAVPTGAGMVFNSSGLKRGDSVAVFGVGGIGLSAVMGAASLGAAPIIAVDPNPMKLAKARDMGATHTVNPAEGDPVAAIRAMTGGAGVRVAIECSGSTTAMEAAFESVTGGGGLCIVAGNPRHDQTMRIDPFSLIKGKRLTGSWGGESQPDTAIPHYIAMFMEGRLALERLETTEYTLEDINRAVADMEEGRVTRAIIRMSAV